MNLFLKHIPYGEKFKLILLVFFSFFVSIVELISIASIAPFIGILFLEGKFKFSIFEKLSTLDTFEPYFNDFRIYTIYFISVTILSGLLRIMLTTFSINYSNRLCAKISLEIYRKSIFQNYKYHISNNTNILISNLTQKTNDLLVVIQSSVLLITSFFLFLSILIVFILTDIKIAFYSLGYFSLLYFFIVIFTKNKIKANSINIVKNENSLVKTINESFGGIRDVIVNNRQNFYINYFKKKNYRVFQGKALNSIFSQFPRFLLESLGISFVALFVLILDPSTNQLNNILPTLGVIALGSQKLYPVVNQIYNSLVNIFGRKASILQLNEVLILKSENKFTNKKKLSFCKSIQLKNIYYKYSKERDHVLKKVNFKINYGEKIGIIGESGAGKSTFLDLLMGLIEAEKGQILCDGIIINSKNRHLWFNNLAHVSQDLFLVDDSIRNNITLGQGSISDDKKLQKCIEVCDLITLIEELNDGLETIIGERGVKISGGQKQRICLARALYQEKDILILDEATSALDPKSEKIIFTNISKKFKNMTMLIVSHKKYPLKYCDSIYRIKDKSISKLSTS